MRVFIRMDTLGDVEEFVKIANSVDCPVSVKDNSGHSVNAKSKLGMLYSLEFSELICECEQDIYGKIEKFVVL